MRLEGWQRDIVVLTTGVLLSIMTSLVMSHLIHGVKGSQGIRGIQGVEGKQGPAAQTVHLGVCVSTSPYVSGVPQWVDIVEPATISSGVISCPIGSFVSVVPGVWHP